jgi:hypothetical protein
LVAVRRNRLVYGQLEFDYQLVNFLGFLCFHDSPDDG